MFELSIVVEPATPAALAPFGCFVGAEPALPRFAEWPGVTAYGPLAITIGSNGEILHMRMGATRFPARVQLFERHFHHTQTYLAATGRPFVMVLGKESTGDRPDIQQLNAFLFRDGAGIAMPAGVWHEFPLALQADTRSTVILPEQSSINRLEPPVFPNDTSGPDRERWDIAARSSVWVRMLDAVVPGRQRPRAARAAPRSEGERHAVYEGTSARRPRRVCAWIASASV